MLSQRWSRLVQDIRELYQELDEEVAAFAGKSGMSCPPGCGACCRSPQVEATVAEMLPLACLLFARGGVEETLGRLERGSSLCAQYEAQTGDPDRGRCRNYAERPVLCRLFGYTGARDKSGQLQYRGCRVFQKQESARLALVNEALRQKAMAIPVLTHAHERVSEIAGFLAEEVLPINQALWKAISIIGLDLQLHDEQVLPHP